MRLIMLPWILAVALMAPLASMGQTSSVCPKLEVVPPRGMINIDEAATFVLQSEQDFPEAYKYEWVVENGTITGGQGTRVIEAVSYQYGVELKATALVNGLVTGCPNSAAASIEVVRAPHIGAIDEWGEMPNDDQRGRLDLFFAEMSNNPGYKGLIVMYSKNRTVERRRLNLYLDHARFRKFDKSELTFCLNRAPQTSTRLYLLTPAFLDRPEPACKLISGSLLK